MNISMKSPLLTRAGYFHGFSTREIDLAFDGMGYTVRLERFVAAIGLPPGSGVHQLRQVHGARVVRVPGVGAPVAASSELLEEGDALVSDRVPVGVRVADCVPILVGVVGGDGVKTSAGGVAAIHAGWRGVAAGVVGAALAKLGPGERVAAIGPCIGPCCFEVDAHVAETIAAACAEPAAIARRDGGKAHVDLRLAVRAQLRAAGLTDAQIEDVPGCTRCDASTFFSYRREAARAGRHLAAIAPRAFRG